MGRTPVDSTIKPNSRLLPLVAGILLLLQLAWPNRAWVILIVILGGGWGLSYLWARSLRKGLHLDREVRYGWVQVGDRLEQRFTVKNKNWAPALWLEVDDRSNLPGYAASRVTAVDGDGTRQWSIAGTCSRRGLFQLGPTCLRCGDPLGLFNVELQSPETSVLLVLPPVLPIPHIEIAAGGRAGESRRERRSAFETTVSVDTVREYLPGDPLRAIHWPTSARREKLYIRQFEHTPSSDWWIFLDLEGKVQIGEGADSTIEHGVILAASLADRGLREGHAVGFVTFSGKELCLIPARHQSGQLMDILRSLAMVTLGEASLSKLLEITHHSMRGGASLILITPNVDQGWVPALTQAKKMGVSPTVFLLDPVSFGGSNSPIQMTNRLTQSGIVHSLIHRELLNRLETHPGRQGLWEWMPGGWGKGQPMHRPENTDWRRLG